MSAWCSENPWMTFIVLIGLLMTIDSVAGKIAGAIEARREE